MLLWLGMELWQCSFHSACIYLYGRWWRPLNASWAQGTGYSHYQKSTRALLVQSLNCKHMYRGIFFCPQNHYCFATNTRTWKGSTFGSREMHNRLFHISPFPPWIQSLLPVLWSRKRKKNQWPVDFFRPTPILQTTRTISILWCNIVWYGNTKSNLLHITDINHRIF